MESCTAQQCGLGQARCNTSSKVTDILCNLLIVTCECDNSKSELECVMHSETQTEEETRTGRDLQVNTPVHRSCNITDTKTVTLNVCAGL
jgi:hypothetical protein